MAVKKKNMFVYVCVSMCTDQVLTGGLEENHLKPVDEAARGSGSKVFHPDRLVKVCLCKTEGPCSTL